jgi:carboxypeptidase family protein
MVRITLPRKSSCSRWLGACALGAMIGVAGFPRPGWAQGGVTVKGFIENHTGFFVSYATCTLVARNSTDSHVAVADTLGRFTFQNIVPGSYLIETKAPGYAPREVAVTVSTKPISGLKIVLKPGSDAIVSNEPEVPAATPAAQIPTAPGTQGLPPQPQPLPVTERLPRLWSVGFGITNSYDTNVDHNQANVGAYGLAYGTTIAYKSAHVRPLFQVAYDLTRYTVPSAARWTRLSHRVRTTVERRLNRRVYFDVVGDVNSGGASEDREIVNQYLVRPRVEFRLPRDHRLRVYTAYRLKKYTANELRNARNLYTGLELQRRLESGDRWTIGYRYEENRATGPRYQYRRLTYETEYATQVTDRDVVAFNVVFRSQKYPFRMAELNDVDVPRHNQRWIPTLSWGHRIGEHVEARLDYIFETQASNDMDEEYDAQNLGFSFGFRW